MTEKRGRLRKKAYLDLLLRGTASNEWNLWGSDHENESKKGAHSGWNDDQLIGKWERAGTG